MNNQVTIKFNRNSSILCTGVAKFIVEKNGKYSWYLPGFEMYFTSRTKEEGKRIATAMVKSFFIYWIEKENDFSQLIREITRLGFKAMDHRNTVNKMLRGKSNKGLFSIAPVDTPGFNNAETQELELQVA